MVRPKGIGGDCYDDEEGDRRGFGGNSSVQLKEVGVSCMLSTEVGALLAVIRRPVDPNATDVTVADTHVIVALKNLRSLIFQPHGEWHTIDPVLYISPFINVIQSDEIPAPATALAISAVLKIIRLNIFDEKTPGAGDAIQAVVHGITNCRLERTDHVTEDAVLMRILQVLLAVMRSRVSAFLTDHAVTTVVNTCFQVVQHSACRGDMLQKNARHTMHELVQIIFIKLPEIKPNGSGKGSEIEFDEEGGLIGPPVYGTQCMVDIFKFLCSLLNVVVECSDGLGPMSWDEDVQLFALILINSAIELGGEAIGNHPRLLWTIQDELFYYLIYYGTRSTPLFLSMICSTVLNLYHFLRRSLRLQLEAFFRLVLLRVTSSGNSSMAIQEVAVEGIISFCRQPMFVIEMYVNYDSDPICSNVFEEIGKLLCKIAFPTPRPFSPMQVQAFEGLVSVIGTIAEHKNLDEKPEGESYQVQISDFQPFWLEKCSDITDIRLWTEFVRMRKTMKKRVMIAANHWNRDEKKGLEFMRVVHLVPDPPDPLDIANFLRYTPGLDKNKIGDYMGDPDEFNLKVLKEFSQTFDFSGVILDTALRTFLETFRLPGESQKIQRILETFSERFYEQQTSEIFANKDAVFILCYSLIMLNTDQHNAQVKKKMTEEEFIKNNRAINNGKDLPRDYLSELFCSISNNAITVFGQNAAAGGVTEMNPNRWVELLKRSRSIETFITPLEFNHKLCRDLFVPISGPSVACLSAIFDRADDDEILQDSMKGLLHIARIAQYGLEDILDELLTCFCKCTTLLNPYLTPEETLFSFSHDLKPRLATLAVFTIANQYGGSVRGEWRNTLDCLLKLNKMRVLPSNIIESSGEKRSPSPSTSSTANLMSQFSQFLTMDRNLDSMASIGNEFESNLKLIEQCRIRNIFTGSWRLPEESLQNLGRALIFAAAGKNQKFSTPIEEEETVGFCWDLLMTISAVNINRSSSIWPQFFENFTIVAQFPLFSPCPFAEKGIVGIFSIYVKYLAAGITVGDKERDKVTEEYILKSINMMWKFDKEVLDTCCDSITDSIVTIFNESGTSIQSILGWKTLLHLLSIAGRHPETYDRAVQALTMVMTVKSATHITRYNYAYFIDAAFGFTALRISPLENSLKLLDLMAGSIDCLIQYHTSHTSDPDNATGDPASAMYLSGNLFLKLAEALRKTSLVRREEIRNHAVSAIRRIFDRAVDLDFTPTNCIGCFNLVIFAMVDDLHEKTVEYSRRDNSEREMRSMEITLKAAMEMMVDVYLKFLMVLQLSPAFRTFWLGLLRRMDTCMKANIDGEAGLLQSLVPVLLKKMIREMKAKEVLVEREGDELYEITSIQIQWIAPSIKDELLM